MLIKLFGQRPDEKTSRYYERQTAKLRTSFRNQSAQIGNMVRLFSQKGYTVSVESCTFRTTMSVVGGKHAVVAHVVVEYRVAAAKVCQKTVAIVYRGQRKAFSLSTDGIQDFSKELNRIATEL